MQRRVDGRSAARPPRSTHLLVATALLASGCTDAGLQPYHSPGPAGFDDKLRIEAEVCTSPAVDAYFPVKILFVVDTSDSMSVTDRGGIRAQAVTEVLQRYAGNPSVEFGVIAFDARIDVLTPGFTNTPDISAITSRLSMADRLTDYQGALGAAYTMLSQDMVASSPAERARSKYVVVFFSDGTPDPQCSSTGVDKYLICEVPKEDWQNAFEPPLDPALYPDLQAGGDYNQPAQILRAVGDIVALQDFYRVGEVRLHTGFLFDPAAAMDPLAAPFGLDRQAGIDIMTRMATEGGGTFTEFDSATKISFLNLNYTSIKEENALASIIATNSNALETSQGLAVDTDGDGLEDAREAGKTCVGRSATCSDPQDSDGDGYSDLLEERNRLSGFDPVDPARPSQGCSARGDSDGDGLRDCEELFLRTDTRLPDSDGDRIADLLEVQAGLDPLDRDDAFADLDRDGQRNIDEIRAHRNPGFDEAQRADTGSRYLYDIGEPTKKPDGRLCYDVTVRNVRLLTTGRGTDSMLGKNRIYVFFLEAPRDRPLDYGDLRLACVDARYVDGAVKAPPSGVVYLRDNQFVRPTQFRSATDCIDLTSVSAGADGGP